MTISCSPKATLDRGTAWAASVKLALKTVHTLLEEVMDNGL